MNNKDLTKQEEKHLKELKKLIHKNYYKTFSHTNLRNFMETILTICFIVFCFVLIIFMFIMLIENPVSLAIICGTILLIIMWGKK